MYSKKLLSAKFSLTLLSEWSSWASVKPQLQPVGYSPPNLAAKQRSNRNKVNSGSGEALFLEYQKR